MNEYEHTRAERRHKAGKEPLRSQRYPALTEDELKGITYAEAQRKAADAAARGAWTPHTVFSR